MSKPYDFFVSYASEDRAGAALPIVTELLRRGYEVWFDQHIITTQQGFDEKIRAGLRECHYGIVILSPSFLRKDWPTRELDILLMHEAIDGRRRILAVVYGMSVQELRNSWPRLWGLEPLSMSGDIAGVCAALESRIFSLSAERKDILTDEERQAPFPPMRGPGLECKRPECPWKPSDEILQMLGADPGPEFTFRRIRNEWFAVCYSCGHTALGPLTAEDVKDLAGLARMIAAPEKRAY